MEKRKVVGVIENHFDQIWRRCFKRDIEYKGERFISYAEIEKNYIDKNLEFADNIPGYKFQIENPCAVETYVEAFPEKKSILKNLYKKGVLKTTNTGYVILDSNLISPEAIIRNYLISDAFFKEYVGATPSLANRSDAFGNSAQLPQILRNFGAEYVTEIYYNPYDDDVWVGLDKTAICVKKEPQPGYGGNWTKYPPCKTCKGYGKHGEDICPTCKGLGIDQSKYDAEWRKVTLIDSVENGGVFRIGGEELMPNANTVAEIDKIRCEQGEDITLGHWDFLLEYHKDAIKKVNNNDFSSLKVRKSPEFNPNTTGGYTTRIKIKQRLCDAENKILTGETIEAMRLILGKNAFSYDRIWRNFLLNAFHDAASGTIVDAGYSEIMDMFDEIDSLATEHYLDSDVKNTVRLFNPTSSTFNGVYKNADGRMAKVEGLAPYSFKTVEYAPVAVKTNERNIEKKISTEVVFTGKEEITENFDDGEIFCVENEYFCVEADDRGIRKITHKNHGVVSQTIDGVRPCEWIIQSDVGSPWAVLEPPSFTESLKDGTNFVCIEKGSFYTKLCYRTNLTMMQSLGVGNTYIDWSLTLVDGYDRVKFGAEVTWIAGARRLMVSFPVPTEASRDIYGIPGGWLEREPYEPVYAWNGADGDWPAFRYGGVESDNKSVAIINAGTPAYKILPTSGGKIIYMTVLRSPLHPICLHEPQSYSMHEYHGMTDEGMHSFDFEMAAYGTSFAKSNIVRDSEQFCRRPLAVSEEISGIELPLIISGTASITHVKPAENGDGIIVRVTENQGIDGEVQLSVPSWTKKIALTDMPERAESSLPCGEKLTVNIRAFKIISLRFEP